MLSPKLILVPIWPALFIILLANLLNLCDSQFLTLGANVIEAPEFMVRAQVRFINANSTKVDAQSEVSEYVSNRYQRTRIQITKLSKHPVDRTTQYSDEITYYYSGSIGMGSILRDTPNNCENVDRRQFYGDLFCLYDLNEDYSSIKDSWLNSSPDDTNSYVIGLSKFLFDLQKNADEPYEDPNKKMIRNQEAIKYIYHVRKDGSKTKDTLYVYYQLRKNSPNPKPDLKKDIPLRLWFNLNDGTEIIIDYMVVTQYHDVEYMNEDGLNRFSYPLNGNCVKDLPATDITKSMDIQSMSFFLQRFKTSKPSTARKWEFVAFDKQSKAMRVDRIRQEKRITTGPGSFMISIIDLKRKQRFFIQQNRGRNPDKPYKCVSQYQPQLTPTIPLPLNTLKMLGPARVRGVEAIAYGSSILPEIFYPVNQYSIDGNLINEPEKMLKCPKIGCLVVYYFCSTASAETDPRQLLRIDVLGEEGLLERFEMQQFAYELLDAPNGDSRHSLFSVRDRCRNNMTTLPINLAVDLKLYIESSTPNDQVENTMRYLANPIHLKRGLQNSLISSTTINAVNLYDFMVEPVARSDEFVVKIRTKLARLNEVPLYKIKFVGTGSRGDANRVTKTQDWTDCFIRSTHMTLYDANPTFSFCRSSCLLAWDLDELNKEESKMEEDECRVYEVVEMKREGEVEDGWYWNDLAENIKNIHPTLQLDDCKGCVKYVAFNVRRSYIISDDFEDEEQENIRKLNKALSGIGLSALESKEIFAPKLPQIDKDTLEIGESEMSLNVCSNMCMSHLACRSYSLCSLPDKLECLISSADLRDLDFLKSLSKVERREGYISIPWTWNDTLSENAPRSSSLFSVKLRADKRCNTYTKRALDAFTRIESGYLMSARSTGVDVTGVNSREKCAKRCLKRNMDFFSLSSEVTKKMELNTKNVDLDQMDQLEATKKELDGLIRSWCGHFAFLSKKSLSQRMLGYLETHSATNKRGYCLLSSSKDPIEPTDETSNKNLNSMPLELGDLRVQEFLYNNLYDEFPGVTLLPDTYIGSNDTLKTKNVEYLKDIMHHKNQQIFELKESIEECAKSCFMQTTNLKPWCRSFSVMKNFKNAKHYLCTYNSMTLADVLALGPEGAHLVWRYSPEKAGYFTHHDPSRQFLFDDYALARVEVRMGLMDLISAEHISGFFRGFAVILVITLSLATGLFLAIKFANFVQKKIVSTGHSNLLQMELPVDEEG